MCHRQPFTTFVLWNNAKTAGLTRLLFRPRWHSKRILFVQQPLCFFTELPATKPMHALQQPFSDSENRSALGATTNRCINELMASHRRGGFPTVRRTNIRNSCSVNGFSR
jgi:hypothetical protein